ncbi:MAG: hypothetical protein HOO87_16745 [Methyloglobulus sp.]|nr:hypothetical protein [Methyloglobulus sp.]
MLVAWGGEKQNGTILFDINGTGCANVAGWEKLAEFLEPLSARLTRVDLAYDDYEGKIIDYEKFRQWYFDGQFNTNGRPPEPSEIGHLPPHKGRTFYVGNRQSVKMVRGYEKGRQLKQPDSPWFRAEVEFKSGGRVLPLDMLINPTKYNADLVKSLLPR